MFVEMSGNLNPDRISILNFNINLEWPQSNSGTSVARDGVVPHSKKVVASAPSLGLVWSLRLGRTDMEIFNQYWYLNY